MGLDECGYVQDPASFESPRTPTINEALLKLGELPAGYSWRGVRGECSLDCERPPIPSSTSCVIVSANFPYHLQAVDAGDVQIASKDLNVGARGVYNISYTVNEHSIPAIKYHTISDPEPAFQRWGPLTIYFGLLLVALCGWTALHNKRRGGWGARKEKSEGEATSTLHEPLAGGGGGDALGSAEAQSHPQPTPPAAPPQQKARLQSLDSMRGLCLFVMIFVNYGGGGYWWLDHSSWNGLTVADILFPWFMFMMGTSMALSYKARETQKVSRMDMVKKVVIRSVKLIAIGLFINNGYDLAHWRIPGVLQYFGVSYMWVAFVILFTGSWDGAAARRAVQNAESNVSDLDSQGRSGGCGLSSRGDPEDTFADLRFFWREWLFILPAPVLWLVITFAVHVDGCGRGYLGPGGYADHGNKRDCTGGAHRTVDLAVFGSKHIYDEPTCMEAYDCITYDPEGLTGGFNAVFLVYLGLVAGRIFVYFKSTRARVGRLVIWGTLLCAIGTILCGAGQNGGVIPVNKNLWSTSFVLVTSGGGYLWLAVLYLVIDHYKLWSGAPFRYLGMNSIFVYTGSELFELYFPFGWKVSNHDHHWNQLAANLCGPMVWTLISAYLFHNKIFYKV